MNPIEALHQLTHEYEQIKLHLAFPNNETPEWRQRTEYALKKRNALKKVIQTRIAVLRQEEKELNINPYNNHSYFMVKELIKYVPDVIVKACNHRAKLKAKFAENGDAVGWRNFVGVNSGT
ncbi:hypothetical protein ACGVWS_11755 [Enterobacteriaceae bacterium LUAb1]